MSHAVCLQARLETSLGNPEISGGMLLLDSIVLRLIESEKDMAEWIHFVVVKSMPINSGMPSSLQACKAEASVGQVCAKAHPIPQGDCPKRSENLFALQVCHHI
jgi:hypothetical protein